VNGSIDRVSPAWTSNLLDSYIRTIDAFSKYDNVLVYNIGNEVVTSPNQTAAAPFVKAAARDIKAYLLVHFIPVLATPLMLVFILEIPSHHLYSSAMPQSMVMPRGLSHLQTTSRVILPILPSISLVSMISGCSVFKSVEATWPNLINSEFCGASTFATSYAGITGSFAGYNVVAYFSEYGCNNPYPRPWNDVAALFGANAAPVWSGGVAFSYFPATSDAGQFGMVTISGNTVTTSTDYTNLQAAYGAVSFVNDPAQSGATASYPSCPAQNSSFLASTTLPPTPNDAACRCLQTNLDCLFNPQTANTTGIVGPLLDTACGLIGTAGGNCKALTASGQTGTYGLVASCDPCNIALSHLHLRLLICSW